MPFVLDASIAVSWALSDESEPAATAALESAGGNLCIVPALWWFEVRNCLLMAERRKLLSSAETSRFLRDLAELKLSEDFSRDDADLLRLARTHKLTTYEAAYLELAQRRGVPLATLDGALARAARVERVFLIGSSS